jgi:hypothetical protein
LVSAAGAASAEELKPMLPIPAAVSAVMAPVVGTVNKSPITARAAKHAAGMIRRLVEPALFTIRDRTS